MEDLITRLRSLAQKSEPWVGDLPSGERVVYLRKTSNLSQEQFAHLTETSRLAVWKYEHGYVERPRALSKPWPRKVLTALLTEASRQRARRQSQDVMEAFV